MKTLVPFLIFSLAILVNLTAQGDLASLTSYSSWYETSTVTKLPANDISDKTVTSTFKKVTKSATIKEGKVSLNEFFAKNLVFPETAKAYGLEGMVVVRIKVSKSGVIEDVDLIKSAHPILDKTIVDLVKSMPAMDPAYIDGKAAQSFSVVPIKFTLQ